MQICFIVDNSEVVCKVAGRIIFQAGFSVDKAHSGAEALDKLTETPLPDMIIVSAGLADMPGDDLVRAIRSKPGGASPIILASLVEANLGQMTRLKRAGVTGFIFKPFDRKALMGWLEPYTAEVA